MAAATGRTAAWTVTSTPAPESLLGDDVVIVDAIGLPADGPRVKTMPPSTLLTSSEALSRKSGAHEPGQPGVREKILDPHYPWTLTPGPQGWEQGCGQAAWSSSP